MRGKMGRRHPRARSNPVRQSIFLPRKEKRLGGYSLFYIDRTPRWCFSRELCVDLRNTARGRKVTRNLAHLQDRLKCVSEASEPHSTNKTTSCDITVDHVEVRGLITLLQYTACLVTASLHFSQ